MATHKWYEIDAREGVSVTTHAKKKRCRDDVSATIEADALMVYSPNDRDRCREGVLKEVGWDEPY